MLRYRAIREDKCSDTAKVLNVSGFLMRIFLRKRIFQPGAHGSRL
jgi:hypothetical protein